MSNKYDKILGEYRENDAGPNNPLYITNTTYFQQIGNTLSLYVNGTLRQEWTTTVTGGSPIGLLLSLTK